MISPTLNSVPSVTVSVVAPIAAAFAVAVAVCSYAVALEQTETATPLAYVPGNFAAQLPTEPCPPA